MKKLIFTLAFLLSTVMPANAIDIDLDSNDAVDVGYGGTNAATAGAARTNLGVVPGTDVQAYDAQLLELAGISAAKIGRAHV